MGFWQILYIILCIISFICVLATDGKKQKIREIPNAVQLAFFSHVFLISCYLFGGFFKVIGWPQIAIIIFSVVSIIKVVIQYQRNTIVGAHAYITGIIIMFNAVVLWYGGFFG